MTTIDLNCDLGESFGPWEMGHDAAMIELATSINVACGYHAGDADIMRKTVEMAKARGVSVGAQAIASAIKAVDPNLVFVVLANSKLVQAGEKANLSMAHEVFADRAYEDDGNLVSRRKPGAVLHDAKEIADRVVRMVQDGAVVSVTGKVIKMRTDTVCIHGDNPAAVDIARGVRKALKDAGIDVAPFKRGS
jgi:UPF0271 protein